MTSGFAFRRVGEADRVGDRLHPLGHDAERAEEGGDRPHDPTGHGVEAQRQRGRNAATAPTEAAPMDQSQIAQPTTARIRNPFSAVRAMSMMVQEPHLAGEGLARLFDGLLGVVDLSVVVGEEFHRVDVGVAVHHPPRGHRAGRSALALDAGSTRRIVQRSSRKIEREPRHQRDREREVGLGQQDRGADEVGEREGDRVEDLEDGVAGAGGGLQ